MPWNSGKFGVAVGLLIPLFLVAVVAAGRYAAVSAGAAADNASGRASPSFAGMGGSRAAEAAHGGAVFEDIGRVGKVRAQ